MTLSGTKKFLAALETAGIKNYTFNTDLGTYLYNGDNAVIVLDEAEEMAYAFRAALPNLNKFADGHINVYGSPLADIHEVSVGGSYEQIKKFIDSYGLSLNDDQLKIILNIDKANYDLKPIQGNYNPFKELTKEELAKLNEEQLKEYNDALRKHELEKAGLSQGMAASITI